MLIISTQRSLEAGNCYVTLSVFIGHVLFEDQDNQCCTSVMLTTATIDVDGFQVPATVTLPTHSGTFLVHNIKQRP